MKKGRSRTEYQKIQNKTSKIVQDLNTALAAQPVELRDQWNATTEGVIHDTSDRLKVAIAGEYNVGKSTLIKALTGLNIDISSTVTTHKVKAYPLDDIVLLDMPGTLSGLQEHDQIAMKAVLESDLLVFVLTNELFNAESLTYFQKAMKDLKKDKQAMLVVNQLDRVNLRDRTLEEAISVMTEALQDMVKPASIFEFRPTFISARDYCDAMAQSNDRLRDDLIRSSRMDSFKSAIDDFCTERGLYGRFARPLQMVIKIASECLQSACSDLDERAGFNYLDRREQIFLQELTSWKDNTRKICEDTRVAIRRCADPVMAAVQRKAEPAEIDSIYEEANAEVDHIVKKTEKHISELIDKTLHTINTRITELNDTPVGKRIMSAKLDITEDLGADVNVPGTTKHPSKKAIKNLSSIMKNTGKGLTKNAEKIGKETAELLRKIIKYKPWGKVKAAEAISKWLGGFGKVLGPLAIGFEMYMNYREEVGKEKDEQERLKFKAAIRGNFISFGDAVYEAASKAFDSFVKEMIQPELEIISQERAKLQQETTYAKQFKDDLIRLQDRAQNLLKEIPA